MLFFLDSHSKVQPMILSITGNVFLMLVLVIIYVKVPNMVSHCTMWCLLNE